MQDNGEVLKTGVDIASLGIVVGTLVQWLPSLAALISIIWGIIRILESRTVQKWLGNKNVKGASD